jgi:hypothetical protein
MIIFKSLLVDLIIVTSIDEDRVSLDILALQSDQLVNSLLSIILLESILVLFILFKSNSHKLLFRKEGNAPVVES